MKRRAYRLFQIACCALLWLAAACSPVVPTDEATAVSQAVSATLTAYPVPTHPPATDLPSPAPTVKPSVAPTATPMPQPTIQPTTYSHTPTPTHSPTPIPLEPTLPPVSGPAVWEQDITLNTYGWQEALVATGPEDPIYPYPRLNFDGVTGPAPRAYRAVFIQNSYVQLVVVPELGGRILRWTDRTTGRQLFYANPVVKPTHWGYRGWWLATGGMEWAFPEEEHGLNEYRPWQYELLWNGVRVWDTEDRTGMTIEVTISLDGAHSYFTLVPRITNPTGEAQSYQFWANAMLTLSDYNAPSPDLTFILPDDAVTVHSTADGSLPGPGGQMTWPVHNGRDLSRYSEWHKYLGVFAHPAQAGFVGAYDLGSDQGIVRVFPHTTATGVKIFCMGDLPSSLWTDDSSRYFELWSGVTPTFWDYWTLQPGASVAWTERWYPVSGIGGYNWANEEAAIRLVPSGDSAKVAVVTSRALNGTVVLRRGGEEVQRWDAFIAPAQPFLATGGAASGGGDWGVQVLDGGTVVAQMGNP
ncbi:MAG: DUF5107 domain-containing protein [Chloroflexi bacterium]|nr:DUF5107 domain-containing protein [Chloroflexota bacterium]